MRAVADYFSVSDRLVERLAVSILSRHGHDRIDHFRAHDRPRPHCDTGAAGRVHVRVYTRTHARTTVPIIKREPANRGGPRPGFFFSSIPVLGGGLGHP